MHTRSPSRDAFTDAMYQLFLICRAPRFLSPPSPPQHSQAVTRGEGETLARDYGMAFFETSAKKDIGVSEAFMSIARQVVSRLGDSGGGRKPGGGGGGGPKPDDKKGGVDIGDTKKKDGKGSCCSK